MTVLIDLPLVERRGHWWSHLASDVSFDELHAFARKADLPERSFDRDHYDVPAHRYDELCRAGARSVRSRDLVAALRAAGLRRR